MPPGAGSEQLSPASFAAIEQAVQAGCLFLTQLYNSTLHLVKETPASNMYHISSDNLLAQQALSYCNQPLRRSVQESLKPYKNGTDMMHEALLGLPIPLPIHNATVYPVANGITGPLWNNIHGNYTIDWEVHNSTGILRDTNYADIAAYTALELFREGNTTGAMHELQILTKTYDGKGMNDTAYTSNTSPEYGIYQTYKAALYLTVLNTLSQQIPPSLVPTILHAQGTDGGFHTGYNPTGSFTGTKENAETTSIVMLALESFPSSPDVVTSPWDSGYQGDSFFLYYTLTNIGPKWLNITSFTVTLDRAIFKQPQGLGLLPPGPGEGISSTVPIPSRISVGNHTITLTTSYQYYDNVSSIWITGNPIKETATLIVRPIPDLDNLPALLAAIVTASLGLFLSLRSFKTGRRVPEAFLFQKPMSMPLTISLLLVTVLAFYLFGFHLLDYRFVSLILFLPVTLAVLSAIVAGEAKIVRKRYTRAILLPLVLFSLSMTLASSIRAAVYREPILYCSGLRSAGFPIPWSFQTIPYLGPLLFGPSACPSTLLFQWWSFFLVDTALYAALGIGIIEAYRRIPRVLSALGLAERAIFRERTK